MATLTMIHDQPLFPDNIRDAESQMNLPDSQSDGFCGSDDQASMGYALLNSPPRFALQQARLQMSTKQTKSRKTGVLDDGCCGCREAVSNLGIGSGCRLPVLWVGSINGRDERVDRPSRKISNPSEGGPSILPSSHGFTPVVLRCRSRVSTSRVGLR